MARFEAGREADIAPGTMVKVSAGGADVLVANIGGRYYAVDDTCTHSGASLSEGGLEGCTVTCGWHKAEFDCTTGRMTRFPASIRDLGAYPTSVEGGTVFVEV